MQGKEKIRPAVYIMASRPRGTLYIGVTSNLTIRCWQHRNHLAEGFTSRYGIDQLVYYEAHENMESAILREKQLKRWKRKLKIELIESFKPRWIDNYTSLF